MVGQAGGKERTGANRGFCPGESQMGLAFKRETEHIPLLSLMGPEMARLSCPRAGTQAPPRVWNCVGPRAPPSQQALGSHLLLALRLES